jgi:hypothetical protein
MKIMSEIIGDVKKDEIEKLDGGSIIKKDEEDMGMK